MSELLMLKSLNNDHVLKSVKAVEKYVETHHVQLAVLITDTGLLVYDGQVLLLNIRVAI